MDSLDIAHLGRASVQRFPTADGFSNHFLLSVAAIGDWMPAWGTNPPTRDRLLRTFYPSEPWLSSAIASLAARNAAFSWKVEGGTRTSSAVQDMLQNADFGKGWSHLITKTSIDLYTQDNGAFWEIIRDGQSEGAAVLGIAHLDAGRCTRTGNPEYPVIYVDREGAMHRMPWYTVVDITDAPTPIESLNGMQICGVSRVFAASRILRDVLVRNTEKLGGRYAGALHLVSGVNTTAIDDVFNRSDEKADNRGLSRYVMPIILGTLDPKASIDVKTIELASMPEGYDEEKSNKWYIAALALGLMVEYQDLAPLPGGGLGTSTQSQTLHLKAKGKGPELFRKLVEQILNFKILPKNASFAFDEKDTEAQLTQGQIRKLRAEARQIDIGDGVLSKTVGRQIALDDGDLRQEYVDMLEAEDKKAERDAQVQADALANNPAPAPAADNLGVVQDNKPGGQPKPQDQSTVSDNATLQPNEPVASKSYSPNDAWAVQRAELETMFGDDMELVLGDVRQRIEARLKRDVKGLPSPEDLVLYQVDRVASQVDALAQALKETPKPAPARPPVEKVVERDAEGRITRVIETPIVGG